MLGKCGPNVPTNTYGITSYSGWTSEGRWGGYHFVCLVKKLWSQLTFHELPNFHGIPIISRGDQWFRTGH
jgi:hypothetical protein